MSSNIDQPNSASELERLLPLLPGGGAEENARLGALLALATADEQALAEAYEADQVALSAYAESQQGEPAIMIGFADSVMAQIASEATQVAAPAEVSSSAASEAVTATHGEDHHQGQILRPSFAGMRSLMAAAALLLAALGLGILFSAEEFTTTPSSNSTGVVAGADLTAPDVDALPVGQSPLADAPEFATPARPGARERRAPRGRRGIVPVDGRGGAQQGNNLLDLMRAFQPPTRVPPLAEGEREVKF